MMCSSVQPTTHSRDQWLLSLRLISRRRALINLPGVGVATALTLAGKEGNQGKTKQTVPVVDLDFRDVAGVGDAEFHGVAGIRVLHTIKI
jgi:hypothetical protein